MQTLKIQSLAIIPIFFLAVCASAQRGSGRTVTNADLEKYREARVKADEDYRQNYAQRGLPSPEELERMETERQDRLSELSSRLESKRLLKEYAEQMSRAANADSQQPVIYVAPQDNYGYSFGYIPFGGFGGTRFRNLSNVQMIRDQASMFPNPAQLSNQNHRRNGFRGGFRSGGARPIFSPGR